MNLKTFAFVLIALGLIGIGRPAAGAGGDWSGYYVGINGGGLWNSTCENWTPMNPQIAPGFDNCPNDSSGMGGVQFGLNVQVQQLVYGFEVDFDGVGSANHNRGYAYGGGGLPAGTYVLSARSPDGIGTFRGRIGYAMERYLVQFYATAGVAFTDGSNASYLDYYPAGSPFPTASLANGHSYGSSGWTAGLGAEWRINRAWSAKVEWLYLDLSAGHHGYVYCAGPAATCNALAGLWFQGSNNDATANLGRIGFNYAF